MKNEDQTVKNRKMFLQKRWFLSMAIAGLIGGAFLISSLLRIADYSFLNSLSLRTSRFGESAAAPVQLEAIIHYATSHIVPQQNYAEISITFNVLKTRSPCNFLVFGLGYDSLMWNALNPGGRTLFLEEDPKWVQTVLKGAPVLRANAVKYKTHLSQADELLSHYKSEPDCSPQKADIRGPTKCRLALTGLPNEFYETEWDLIMIDAPRGYYAEAPGRMGAIFSAAVMARNRKGPGNTHVFLHDVNRRIEKVYAEEFLCKKYMVNRSGRLWHFEIPPVANVSQADGRRFC